MEYEKIMGYVPFFFMAIFFFNMARFISSFDGKQVERSYSRGGIFYLLLITKWNSVTKKNFLISLLSLILAVITEVVYKKSIA